VSRAPPPRALPARHPALQRPRQARRAARAARRRPDDHLRARRLLRKRPKRRVRSPHAQSSRATMSPNDPPWPPTGRRTAAAGSRRVRRTDKARVDSLRAGTRTGMGTRPAHRLRRHPTPLERYHPRSDRSAGLQGHRQGSRWSCLRYERQTRDRRAEDRSDNLLALRARPRCPTPRDRLPHPLT
jgi:hypothetical protein